MASANGKDTTGNLPGSRAPGVHDLQDALDLVALLADTAPGDAAEWTDRA